MSKQFGRMLLYYRKLRGFSQQDLAEKLDVKRNTISSWETGRTEPNMGQIEMMAFYLNCLKSDLLVEDVKITSGKESEVIARKFELADEQTKEMVRRILK